MATADSSEIRVFAERLTQLVGSLEALTEQTSAELEELGDGWSDDRFIEFKSQLKEHSESLRAFVSEARGYAVRLVEKAKLVEAAAAHSPGAAGFGGSPDQLLPLEQTTIGLGDLSASGEPPAEHAVGPGVGPELPASRGDEPLTGPGRSLLPPVGWNSFTAAQVAEWLRFRGVPNEGLDSLPDRNARGIASAILDCLGDHDDPDDLVAKALRTGGIRCVDKGLLDKQNRRMGLAWFHPLYPDQLTINTSHDCWTSCPADDGVILPQEVATGFLAGDGTARSLIAHELGHFEHYWGVIQEAHDTGKLRELLNAGPLETYAARVRDALWKPVGRRELGLFRRGVVRAFIAEKSALWKNTYGSTNATELYSEVRSAFFSGRQIHPKLVEQAVWAWGVGFSHAPRWFVDLCAKHRV